MTLGPLQDLTVRAQRVWSNPGGGLSQDLARFAPGSERAPYRSAGNACNCPTNTQQGLSGQAQPHFNPVQATYGQMGHHGHARMGPAQILMHARSRAAIWVVCVL